MPSATAPRATPAPAATACFFSTLGRTAARGVETQVVAHWMKGFYDDLVTNLKNGERKTFNPYHWEPDTWPATAVGDTKSFV